MTGSGKPTAADWIAASSFAVLYAAVLTFSLLLSPMPIAAVWPSNAVLACALLLLRRRQAGAICTGLAYAAYVVLGLVLSGEPLRPLVMGAMNISESLMLAILVRRLLGPNPNFSDGRLLLKFLLVVVLPVALYAALCVVAAGAVTTMAMRPDPQLWAIGHAMGAATALPIGMVLAQRRRYRGVFAPPIEMIGGLLLLAAGLCALFLVRTHMSLLFLSFPMMILVAFRYGPIGAALGSLMLAIAITLYMATGMSEVLLGGESTLLAKIEWLQILGASITLTSLPVAGAVASYARMRNLLARRTLIARAARSRADAAAAAKSEFLANMSHEIRTPLNGVIGLADALARTALAPAQREMLNMILSSGKALTGLLGDTLDLARADSGALKLAPEPFNVREAVGSAAFLFETVAREKGLGFDVRFDIDAPGGAVGDALRIKQVISNLISNAVKFTAQGQVSVEVSLKPLGAGMSRLRAVVRDTGPGFDETVKARLFRRFEQGDSSVTRRYGGSGLGLAIAHQLTEMMHGSLVCDSAPGRGATFTFTVALPSAAAPAGACLGHRCVATAPAIEGARPSILLAEDHPINQRVIQVMLAELADLTIVADGREALDAWRSRAFDLVLMDTHMPVMDGLSTIRAIRSAEAARGGRRTPIVSLTADAMPQQVQAALAAGADLHLAKPITTEALVEALDRCLGRRGAEPPAAEAAVA